MASISSITSKLAKGTAKAAYNVAGSVLQAGALGIESELGLHGFGIVQGVQGAFSGGGSKGGGRPTAGGTVPAGPSSNMEGLLNQLITVSNAILEATKDNATAISDVSEAINKQTAFLGGDLRQIEDTLKQIAASIGGMGGGGGGEDEGEKEQPGWLTALETIGLGLAASLGAIVGFLKGYLRPLEEFGILLGKAFSSLFEKLGVVFEDAVKMFKSFFSGEGAAGEIGKVFTAIGDAFTVFLKPIEEALQPVAEIFSKVFKWISEVVGTAGEWLGAVGKMMPFLEDMVKVFSLALKWLEPIGWIVMGIQAAYEGITGAIEGYKQGGIWGAIKGALEGLFDALIGGPLDIIKDLISWVSEKLGFKEFSKILDSLSFSDLYKKLLDTVGDVVSGTVDYMIKFFKAIPGVIAGVFSSVWDFVKAIPGKALGYIGDAIGAVSSTVKGWWDKMVGGSGYNQGLDAKEGEALPTVNVQSNRSLQESKNEQNQVSSVSDQGTIVQKSTFGSTAAGALLTAKGKESGSFNAAEVKTSNMQTEDNRANPTTTTMTDFTGRRISGGLFGSDTYEIYKGGQKIEMGKKDYFAVQDLVAAGNIKQAADMVDQIQAANARKAANQGSVEFDAAGNPVSAMTPQNVNFAGVPNATPPTFNQQSAQMAVSNGAAASAAPVVVVNNSSGIGQQAAPAASPPPRTSGAVSTAPASSHIDRALYGDTFGAGVF